MMMTLKKRSPRKSPLLVDTSPGSVREEKHDVGQQYWKIAAALVVGLLLGVSCQIRGRETQQEGDLDTIFAGSEGEEDTLTHPLRQERLVVPMMHQARESCVQFVVANPDRTTDSTGANKDQLMLSPFALLKRFGNNLSTLPIKGESISTGIVWLDTPRHPHLPTWNQGYHLYHFIEILAATFAELHRAGLLPDIGDHESKEKGPASTVPWLFHPFMSPEEVKGTRGTGKGVNDLLLQRLFGPDMQVNGLEYNALSWLEEYPNAARGIRLDLPHNATWTPKPNQDELHEAMMDQADLLLIVRREFCEEGPLLHPETKQKRFPHLHIFADYVDHFPAEEWYDRIVGPMLLQPKKLFLPMSVSLPRDESKLVVAYIDRQGSERFMPSAFHEWLLVQLLGNPDVHLLHLHMEDYTAEQQIYIASQADVMTGVHGNGLTHLLWMNPYAPTYIMEMFWETRFMLLFASLCRLKPQCRHRVIYGGVPFNTTTLNEELEWDIQSWFHPNYYTPEKFADWDEEGAKAYVNGIFQEALEAKRNRLHQK